MKNIKILVSSFIIICMVGLLGFQTKTTKNQFFVIGHVHFNTDTRIHETEFEVNIAGKVEYFSNRYDMLKYMNNNNYSAVSVAFNTYREHGTEIYIFE